MMTPEQRQLFARLNETANRRMLDLVVDSLKMYPSGGGDIRVMAEVDRLRKAAYAEGYRRAQSIADDLDRKKPVIPNWCDECQAPQYVSLDGEHHCGNAWTTDGALGGHNWIVKYYKVTYPCGCKASGPTPLPNYCPDHLAVTL
jgi:hypothetical protein